MDADRAQDAAFPANGGKRSVAGVGGKLGRGRPAEVDEAGALSRDGLALQSDCAVPVKSPSRSLAPSAGRACASSAAAPPIDAAATLVPLTVPKRGVPSSFVPGSAVGMVTPGAASSGLTVPSYESPREEKSAIRRPSVFGAARGVPRLTETRWPALSAVSIRSAAFCGKTTTGTTTFSSSPSAPAGSPRP